MLKINFKKIHILLFSFMLGNLLTTGQADSANSLTMLTYYPAPHGSFDRIQFIPGTLSYPCSIGTIAMDQTTNTLRYCSDDGTGTGVWGALNTTWTESGNSVYPTLTASSPNIFMAIGTSSPEFKLTLDNDGGILALGTLGSGQTLSDFTATSENRFIWYPKKAALRIGTEKGTSWNDVNIGDYSIAFGTDSKASGIASVVIGGGYTMFSTNSGVASGNYATLMEPGFADQNLASGDYSTVATNASFGLNSCSAQYCVAIGGYASQTSGVSATNTSAASGNRATAQGSTIRNGSVISSATLSGLYSTVGGGLGHKPSGDYSTVGGGGSLANTASGLNSTIAGGYSNTASAANTTVGGGQTNNASGASATIAGGYTGQASGTAAIVTGGFTNKANANYAAVIGGNTNTVTGAYSVSTCGQAINPNTVSGVNSAVLNGDKNSNAGDFSIGIGEFITMTATADHTFYWGIPVVNVTASDTFIIGLNRFGIHQTDITATDAIFNIKETAGDFLALTKTTATPGDILIVKNNGYVGIGKYNPSYPLEFGTQASGAYLTVGGVFTNASSRKLKEDIQLLNKDISQLAFSQLKAVKYRYKSAVKERHLGFIAEDAPDLVTDTNHRSINALSVTAILTAAVQNNNHALKSSETEIKALKQELNDLIQLIDRP